MSRRAWLGWARRSSARQGSFFRESFRVALRGLVRPSTVERGGAWRSYAKQGKVSFFRIITERSDAWRSDVRNGLDRQGKVL